MTIDLTHMITSPNAAVTVEWARRVEAEKIRLLALARAERAATVPVVIRAPKVGKAKGVAEKFAAVYAKMNGQSRAAIIAAAVEAGIGKNTAATYYYNATKAK